MIYMATQAVATAGQSVEAQVRQLTKAGCAKVVPGPRTEPGPTGYS
jgi:hypothetical protein